MPRIFALQGALLALATACSDDSVGVTNTPPGVTICSGSARRWSTRYDIDVSS